PCCGPHSRGVLPAVGHLCPAPDSGNRGATERDCEVLIDSGRPGGWCPGVDSELIRRESKVCAAVAVADPLSGNLQPGKRSVEAHPLAFVADDPAADVDVVAAVHARAAPRLHHAGYVHVMIVAAVTGVHRAPVLPWPAPVPHVGGRTARRLPDGP